MADDHAASRDDRAAARLSVSFPATIESIGQAPVTLLPAVAAVYQRVSADETSVGSTVFGTVRDLSSNGAFIACDPLPLLARVLVAFELPSVGPVEAVAWVMWSRGADCDVTDAHGREVTLPRGIGVVFESMALEARAAIARLAS
ncbi:MAG TPA: PilZ domain-containing protein [Kofleriaceae bacterium]|nr:PilZ domain-containing protein [Kofleriaceae bacterium]